MLKAIASFGRKRKPLALSTKGAEFIAQFEGFRSEWYKDPVGVSTIGYGHTGALPAGYKAPLTQKQGLKLLQHDAEHVCAVVREIRPEIKSQTRFDALVSFGYNLGPGLFLNKQTAIGRALAKKRGRVPAVANAMLLYDHAGGVELAGLTRRRHAEATLWEHGQYS